MQQARIALAFVLASLPVFDLLGASPGPQSAPSFLEFVTEQRERRWVRVPRKVLAFYYTWYGTPERHGGWVHWEGVAPEAHDIASSTHYPAKGAYDSHDPAIIDRHIDEAKASGVDGFICTWWGRGTFDDRAFATVLERARLKDFAVTIYWETAPGQGEAQVERAAADLTHVLERYGRNPAFLKVEGKPVLFVYGRVMGEVAARRWPEIIARTRARAPSDFLLIADGYTEAFARLFDGVHTYNICGWVQRKTPEELRALSRGSFASAVDLAKRNAKIACVTIIPGYDDTKIRKPGLKADRQDGATYEVLWEEAIRADPDWILITSWNEWHEGSEIEPSWEDGDRYLRLTAKHAPLFKRTPTSGVPVPQRAVPAETARALRAALEGRTVALLPDFEGEAAYWLAETGVSLEELSWEEVVDPKTFVPGKYPITLYAGYEGYRQRVREAGDVDAAIVGYLEAGGLLMVLPAGPCPFHQNEAGEAVGSASRFGVRVLVGASPSGSGARGWESPPAGVTLGFEFEADLLDGVPRRGPFPASGDIRWRPVTRDGLAEGDVYLPLAKLTDEEGRWYGDGIAYIEHRVTPPRNGKLLYAWMRMTDAAGGKDALLLGLFRLAARKATRR